MANRSSRTVPVRVSRRLPLVGALCVPFASGCRAGNGADRGQGAVPPFSAENRRLAGLVQQETLAAMTGALGHSPLDWGAADDAILPTPFTTACTSYHHDVELGPSQPGWIAASRMPGVISEPLFLTHPEEQAALLKADVLQPLASGYVRAIQADFAGTQPAQPG